MIGDTFENQMITREERYFLKIRNLKRLIKSLEETISTQEQRIQSQADLIKLQRERIKKLKV